MNSQATHSNSFKQDTLVISIVGLAHGISHFFHLILAPLFPWLKDEFSLSYAELGLLMTVFFVISAVMQTFAGFVVDKIGARKVLFFGVACFLISALILAAAPNYYVLLLGSMLAGLGNSVFHPADFTILNKHVSTQRISHAFSAHGISGNLGWAAAPIFLVGFAQAFGWRIALLAAAALPMIVLVFLYIYRDLLETDTDVQHQESQSKPNSSGMMEAFQFLRLPALWWSFVFFFFFAMALGGVHSFASTAMRDIFSMSLSWATFSYTLYMLCSAIGMVWGGFIAARTIHHDKTIFIALSISSALSLLIATGLINAVFAIILMGAVGLGAGVAGPSRDLLIRAASPKNATGRVYGIVYSALDIGLAVSPVLFGAIMDAKHPHWVFVTIALLQILALLTAGNVGKKMRGK